MKSKYCHYVEAAQSAKDDLLFLLDYFGVAINLDYSENSLVELEELYWTFFSKKNYPPEFGSIDDFAELICRYMGQCITENTTAKWSIYKEKNRYFGFPCIDGFGNQPWDIIHPVVIANNFSKIPSESRRIPGAKTKRVLAEAYRKAIRVYNKSVSSS
jgi:hypothetical protein